MTESELLLEITKSLGYESKEPSFSELLAALHELKADAEKWRNYLKMRIDWESEC